MNKITSINLSGHAYQLEEEAYTLLQLYLEQAQSKLSDDPDKDEVLHDFEQAIADKCEQLLSAHKNVVTTQEMQSIIASMGPVEVNEDEDAKHETNIPQNATPPKRFYTLKEGAIFGGVCTGVAAYFRVDVTIIRLIFIVLTFATSGFWLLAYFLILAFAPEARTPEQKAELRGERFTAQDLLARAQQKYTDLDGEKRVHDIADKTAPALSNAGRVILRILRILAGIAAAFAGMIIALATIVWVAAMWALVFGGLNLNNQPVSIPTWELVLGGTALYTIVLIPIAFMGALAKWLASSSQISRQNAWQWTTAGAVWLVMATVLICVGGANASQIDTYQRTHGGYIDIKSHHICIDHNRCDPVDTVKDAQ